MSHVTAMARPAREPVPVEFFDAAIPGALTETDAVRIPNDVSCATFTFELATAGDIEFQVYWRTEPNPAAADQIETDAVIASALAEATCAVTLCTAQYVSPLASANFDFTIAIPANKFEVGLRILSRNPAPGNARISVSFR